MTYNQSQRAQPLIAQFGTILLLDSFIYQSDVTKVYEMGPNMAAKLNGDRCDHSVPSNHSVKLCLGSEARFSCLIEK